MPDNNEHENFKLNTRRWLAWSWVGLAALSAMFLVFWGAIHNIMAMVTLGGTALFSTAAGIIGFYFGKKASEE